MNFTVKCSPPPPPGISVSHLPVGTLARMYEAGTSHIIVTYSTNTPSHIGALSLTTGQRWKWIHVGSGIGPTAVPLLTGEQITLEAN